MYQNKLLTGTYARFFLTAIIGIPGLASVLMGFSRSLKAYFLCQKRRLFSSAF